MASVRREMARLLRSILSRLLGMDLGVFTIRFLDVLIFQLRYYIIHALLTLGGWISVPSL